LHPIRPRCERSPRTHDTDPSTTHYTTFPSANQLRGR
jgi:hypothetical protein